MAGPGSLYSAENTETKSYIAMAAYHNYKQYKSYRHAANERHHVGYADPQAVDDAEQQGHQPDRVLHGEIAQRHARPADRRQRSRKSEVTEVRVSERQQNRTLGAPS